MVASSSSTSVISSRKRKAESTDKRDASPPEKKLRNLPHKKSAAVSVRVEVSPNDPEYDPIVVSFPRGVPSSIAGDGNGKPDADPPKFSCTTLKANSTRGRLVTGEDGNCTYSASAAGRGHDGRLTKAYVCIYDKRKKTLRLVPAAVRGTIFALEQTVKEYTPNVANGSMLVGSGQASASDRLQMLVESFGSKKKQKVMASRAANKVDIHSVVGAGVAMMRSVEKQQGISLENKKGIEDGSNMVNPNDVAYEQARRKMLPPYNENADAPCKVYDVQAIVGTVAWDKVSRIVDRVLKKKSEGTEKGWIAGLMGVKGFRPRSIETLLKSIELEEKGSPLRIKAAFFLFMTMKFRNRIIPKGIIEGGSIDDCIAKLFIPHEVGLRVFELFTSQIERKDGGYASSKQQQTKLTAYLLVLYVIANGNNMKVPSMNQFCRDIKLDLKDALLVLREAGFKVTKNGEGNMGASLSLPLKFPPPKRGRRA